MAKENRFTDESGTQYEIGELLGSGIEGKVFRGKIITLGPNADPRLQVGTEVAIKQQAISTVPTHDASEIAKKQAEKQARKKETQLKREFKILSKLGNFFGSATVTEDGKKYMYAAIPLLPGKTLRNTMYEIDNGEVVGRKDLTTEDKNNICYSLLRHYAAQQMLSVLHVDIKPDNIMYNPKTGEAKPLDFGNGYDASIHLVHPEGFQSPGFLYAAPENYDPPQENDNAPPPRKPACSAKADLYAVGIMLASVWSEKDGKPRCYEKEAQQGRAEENSTLCARASLDDILGEPPKKPKDMPDDLFTIIRHLTATDPSKRPENIALAAGVDQSARLREIRDSQERFESLRQTILKSHPAQDIPKGTVDSLAHMVRLCEIVDCLMHFSKNKPEKFKQEYTKILKGLNEEDIRILEGNESILKSGFTPLRAMEKISENLSTMLEEIRPKQIESLAATYDDRINKIFSKSHDISETRIQLSNLYKEIHTLRKHDINNKDQYDVLLSMIGGHLKNLDNIRDRDSKTLQGIPQAVPKKESDFPKKPKDHVSKSNFLTKLINTCNAAFQTIKAVFAEDAASTIFHSFTKSGLSSTLERAGKMKKEEPALIAPARNNKVSR